MKGRLLLTGGALLFGALAFGLSSWRWWTYQYTTFDLAFYVQALWLTLHGHSGTTSLLGVPLLGNHAEPIVYLALPLFALCPHPMLLPALQIAALATMPFTARRIALRLGFAEGPAALLALVTLLMPATGYVAIHEFHPEALAAPLLLLLYEARQRERFGWFAAWFLLVLACKENMALLLVAWHAVAAWSDRARGARWQVRWNFGPALVAALWFGIYAGWLAPWLNGGRVDYGNLYAGLNGPLACFGALWRGLTQGNLAGVMLLSGGGLVLLRPRWLLIALPILLQHLLSWRSSEWTVWFHYAAPLVPLVWLAAAEATARRPRWWVAVPVGFCVVLQPWYGAGRELAADWQTRRLMAWNRSWKAPLVAEIAADRALTVVCGMPYLSHLAEREGLYPLHLVLKGTQTLSRVRYEPDYLPDMVLLDYGDAATFNKLAAYYHPPGVIDGRPIPSSDELLAAFLARRSWSARSINELTVLRAKPDQPGSGFPAGAVQSAVLKPQAGGREGTLAVEWAAGPSRSTVPWLKLALHGPAGDSSLLLGMAAPLPNEEHAWLFPPWFPAGTYTAQLVWYDQIRALWGKENRDPFLGATPLGNLSVQ